MENDPVEYVGKSNERAEPLPVSAPVANVAPIGVGTTAGEDETAAFTKHRVQQRQPYRVAEISPEAAVIPAAEAPPIELVCDPFDQLGAIIAPPVEIVAALSVERRSLLMALLKANLEAKEAEEFIATTQRKLYAAVNDARNKRAEFERLKPQTTHVDELRRVIAARNGTPLPMPPVNPKAEAAAIVADKADDLITTLQSRLPRAQVELSQKRAALSTAIMAWQGFKPRRQVWEVVKENAAAESARRLDRIARGEPVDGAATAEPVYREPVDQIYASHRGSVNVNWRRPPGALRGPAAKVASEP